MQATHCDPRASHCGGFSCCGARALECWLSGHGSRAYLFRSTRNLPRPGIKPQSPALAGRFFITEPLGKPWAPPFEGRSIKECVDFCHTESESRSVVSDSLWPHGLYRLWNSPGRNTGVGSLSLLQGIFPIQWSNPGLPHCRQILYQLSHKGSP